VSFFLDLHRSGFEFVVLPTGFVAAREHARSEVWSRMFAPSADPLHQIRVAALWRRQKEEKWVAPAFDVPADVIFDNLMPSLGLVEVARAPSKMRVMPKSAAEEDAGAPALMYTSAH
jgi:hypothetical protein